MILIVCCLGTIGCQNGAKQQEQLRQGYELLDQQQYDQALDAANRYLEQHPSGAGTAEATYLRGRATEQRVKANDAEAISNLQLARETYLQAAAMNPGGQLASYIQTSLGNVAFWLEDYATAEVQWIDAFNGLNQDQLKCWVLYRIGVCQQRQGKWAAADETFASAHRQYPGTDAALRALQHMGARQFYVQVAAFQQAASADKLIVKLRGQGFPALRLAKSQNNLQLVMSGPVRTYPEAVALRNRLNSQQYKDVMIVP